MLFNYCILFICLHALTTCVAKTDVVTEPTPAGTGVIIEALSTQSANLTSPQKMCIRDSYWGL